ncbi:MAG: precorrin-6y C5,15-methyltransferase (decarboxylating) subunit CbiE [Nitrospirae bacterium]|nr:precorrin-6y C5,15-methyltransferase (decarboxylating) subunit CbiE [Nitrospirota bacterium]
MGSVIVIGIAPGSGVADEHVRLIERCGFVVASNSQRPLIDGVAAAEIFPVAPVQAAIEAVRKRLNISDVVVLASGDPLFFGIARRLIEEFGKHKVCVIPAVSSMQAAFARFRETWDDAAFISLHGRCMDNIVELLERNSKSFILTDPANNPAAIASRIADESAAKFEIFVAERLGATDERLTAGRPDDIAQMSFAEPCVMIVKRLDAADTESTRFPLFGLREDEIAHSRGLITKDEVRAAALHRLRLPERGVLWDIGAGSGSVSVEAARLSPRMEVFAIEKEPAEIANIRANIERFQASNIRLIEGEAPSALSALPHPDRVFIGGSGGQLAQIIEVVGKRLKPGGIVAVNAVIERTAEAAPKLLMAHGFRVETSKIAVSRTRWNADGSATTELNPITIITGYSELTQSTLCR